MKQSSRRRSTSQPWQWLVAMVIWPALLVSGPACDRSLRRSAVAINGSAAPATGEAAPAAAAPLAAAPVATTTPGAGGVSHGVRVLRGGMGGAPPNDITDVGQRGVTGEDTLKGADLSGDDAGDDSDPYAAIDAEEARKAAYTGAPLELLQSRWIDPACEPAECQIELVFLAPVSATAVASQLAMGEVLKLTPVTEGKLRRVVLGGNFGSRTSYDMALQKSLCAGNGACLAKKTKFSLRTLGGYP